MNTVLSVHQSIGLSKRAYLLGDFPAISLRGFQALIGKSILKMFDWNSHRMRCTLASEAAAKKVLSAKKQYSDSVLIDAARW